MLLFKGPREEQNRDFKAARFSPAGLQVLSCASLDIFVYMEHHDYVTIRIYFHLLLYIVKINLFFNKFKEKFINITFLIEQN